DRAVTHGDRLDAGFADVKGRLVDVGEVDVWDQANPRRAREGIAEALAKRSARRRIAEAGQDAAEGSVEGLEIVDAGGVVSVKVGEQDGVDAGDAFAQGLQADFGAGIDEQAAALVRFDVDRGAGALVARVGADARMAPT